jgi:large subunit ribosomal protein L6
MSRIGKKPIDINSGISVTVTSGNIMVSGPKGQMNVTIPDEVSILQNSNILNIDVKNKEFVNLQGLVRTQIHNAIVGVTSGWSKTLELVGVGYRAQTTGSELELSLGFSHTVKVHAPSGITFSVNENKITVNGADKYLVGEQAAIIRRLKPPEPYKGKGIRYLGEYIRKKLGKAAKAVGAATGAK